MSSDNCYSACEKLVAAAKSAVNRQEANTLYDLRRVLCIATTPVAAKWSAKVERIIAHVHAGNYANTDEALRRMWNKRVGGRRRAQPVPCSRHDMEAQ